MSVKIHIVKQTKKTTGLIVCLLILIVGSLFITTSLRAQAATLIPSPAPTLATAGCSASAGCDLVANYVNPFIKLLTILFGAIAAISLILGAIQYISSEGDPQKSSRAKNRMVNTVFAIIAYAVLYGFLQFLLPKGAFQ